MEHKKACVIHLGYSKASFSSLLGKLDAICKEHLNDSMLDLDKFEHAQPGRTIKVDVN